MVAWDWLTMLFRGTESELSLGLSKFRPLGQNRGLLSCVLLTQMPTRHVGCPVDLGNVKRGMPDAIVLYNCRLVEHGKFRGNVCFSWSPLQPSLSLVCGAVPQRICVVPWPHDAASCNFWLTCRDYRAPHQGQDVPSLAVSFCIRSVSLKAPLVKPIAPRLLRCEI